VSVYVCVCVCEREREREREIAIINHCLETLGGNIQTHNLI
jgi:hypothetical protein